MKPPRRSTAFAVLFAVTIGAFLAENLLYFPLSVLYMRGLAAGAPLLDMRPGYTPDAVYQLFGLLGQTGRGAYLKLLWTVDLLLPALFGVFLASAIRRGAFSARQSIPLLAAACDYAENITITILLLRYPMHEPGVSTDGFHLHRHETGPVCIWAAPSSWRLPRTGYKDRPWPAEAVTRPYLRADSKKSIRGATRHKRKPLIS